VKTKRTANIFDICIRKVSKEARSYTYKLTHTNTQATNRIKRNTLRKTTVKFYIIKKMVPKQY